MKQYQKRCLLTRLNKFAQHLTRPDLHRDRLKKLAMGYPLDAIKFGSNGMQILEESGLWSRTDGFPHGYLPVIQKYFGITEQINPWIARIHALTDLQLYVLYRVVDFPFKRQELNKKNAGGLSTTRNQLAIKKNLLTRVVGRQGVYQPKPELLAVWPQWKEENMDRLLSVIDEFVPPDKPLASQEPELEPAELVVIDTALYQVGGELSLDDLKPKTRQLFDAASEGPQNLVLGMMEPGPHGERYKPEVFDRVAGVYLRQNAKFQEGRMVA